MNDAICRKEFVERFMRECGMSFSDACKAFECMCNVFKDGVVTGSKVRLGKLGVLQPVWHNPKAVHMGVRVRKGRRYERKKHVYFVGKRISYRLKIYRTFMQTHRLYWLTDDWPVDEELKSNS